ncbi:MAG TPA: FAD-dependent oxidoreductase [Ktedonobacterales bacterium]|jgi:phytoene dehydrogenase-like protein|nr:FAD-dependent oxidoreductase [Ktedonobacterales bacterium]
MTTANVETDRAQREAPTRSLDYDVVVIGAGLGGLLSAAQFLRRGQRVAVVERLAHPGGRFTAKTFQGAQVSTGAVHMLPFGTNGELAAMLRALGVPHAIHDSEVFASFHVRGQQIVTRSVLQLARVLGARQFAQFAQLGYAMLLREPRPAERQQTYRQWLDARISRADSPELYAYFERVCHFALSVDLDDVLYPEIVETTRNMFRYGAPGIVEGGCAALTGELARRVTSAGGETLLEHETLAIVREQGAANGALVRDKRSGEVMLLRAPIIISNIGPDATQRLLSSEMSGPSATEELAAPRREASGLKTHLLADESIIPHRGIMYCLDTERIAGIVQPSNSDRRLAPPGKHLLITHQLMRSDDVNAEREAARADLRYLFGDDFGTKVRILTMSQYRGEWPVNRKAQGSDVSPRTDLAGLYLVGDAVKPSGYLMVEGVAQSVNALLDTLDGWDVADMAERVANPGEARHPNTPSKPSKRRAFHWLVAPPPPNPGSASVRHE